MELGDGAARDLRFARGVMGLARLFVENGYAVLTPDNRGHGESGGGVVTYGLRKRDDVHRWVDWLVQAEHPRNVYGMGESLNARSLTLSVWRRIGWRSGFQALLSARRALAVPMVWSGFLYARMRYGLDFRAASPEATIGNMATPVLLIHGLADTNIYPAHSEMLAARNPRNITLWLVPGAGHTAALGVAPLEFRRRVLGWFAEHERQP